MLHMSAFGGKADIEVKFFTSAFDPSPTWPHRNKLHPLSWYSRAGGGPPAAQNRTLCRFPNQNYADEYENKSNNSKRRQLLP
jgi:hypothetical protein